MGGHIGRLGTSLGKSVESYNQAVASLETRVMVTARKFKDLEAGAPGQEIEALDQVDHVPRQLQAPELQSVNSNLEVGNSKDSPELEAE